MQKDKLDNIERASYAFTLLIIFVKYHQSSTKNNLSGSSAGPDNTDDVFGDDSESASNIDINGGLCVEIAPRKCQMHTGG